MYLKNHKLAFLLFNLLASITLAAQAYYPKPELIWTQPFSEPIYKTLVANDHTLYVLTGGSETYVNLYAVNKPASWKWEVRFDMGDDYVPIYMQLSQDEKQIFVGTSWDAYSYDTTNGKLIWHVKPKEQVKKVKKIIPAAKLFFVRNNYNYLYALDQSNGDLVWAKPLVSANEEALISKPIVGNNGLIYISVIRHFNDQAYLLAINNQGEEQWRFAMPSVFISLPALDAQGNLYVVTNKEVYSISPTGKQNWVINLARFHARGADFYTQPTIDMNDGSIYTEALIDKKLYGIALDTQGKVKWQVDLNAMEDGEPVGLFGPVLLDHFNKVYFPIDVGTDGPYQLYLLSVDKIKPKIDWGPLNFGQVRRLVLDPSKQIIYLATYEQRPQISAYRITNEEPYHD